MSMNTRHNIVVAAVSVLLLGFLMGTNPDRLPLPLLIVPFLLVYVLVYALMKWYLLRHLRIAQKRKVITAGVTALVPTLLLMFQSIHQLTARDIFVIIALASVTGFYISKADFID